MFFFKKSTRLSHPFLRILIVPGFPVLKQNLVVLLQNGWNSVKLCVWCLNAVLILTCYNLTRKIF